MKLKILLTSFFLAIMLPSVCFAAHANNYDMAVALIKYDIEHESWLNINMKMDDFEIYIKVDDSDLPSEYLKALRSKGLKCYQGSKMPMNKGIILEISKPIKRADGDYNVSYTFRCGVLCGSSNKAVLRLNEQGWSVISSKMEFIS